ncbi:MAG: hypothetical protein ACFB2Z_06540, partial [Maricaulaceae bacterium]
PAPKPTPASAAPADGGPPERFYYGQPAFTLVNDQTGTEAGAVTEYARDWGRERAEVYDTTVRLGALPLPKRERKVFRSGRATTINEQNGRSRSATAPTDARILASSAGRSPEEAGALIMAAVGGRATGERGAFAGHGCEYYENPAIGARACVADWGGTLYLRVRLGGAEFERTVTEVRLGDPGSDAVYATDG